MACIDVFAASDYAGVKGKNFSFYFGYEEIDDNGEWCFKSVINEETSIIPCSKLCAKDQWDCVENLLHGIGIVLDDFINKR